jgi:hypothetical protein
LKLNTVHLHGHPPDVRCHEAYHHVATVNVTTGVSGRMTLIRKNYKAVQRATRDEKHKSFYLHVERRMRYIDDSHGGLESAVPENQG